MDVNSRAFLINPYVFYDHRRARGPIFQREPHVWTITGYQAMSSLLANPAAGRGNVGQTPRQHGSTQQLDSIVADNPALGILQEWMLFQNPPQHGHSRGQIADVFTTKMIRQMEASMRDTMRHLLQNAKQNLSPETPLEIVASLAYPFPATVICDMIGIPAADRSQFVSWTAAFSEAVQINFHQADAKNLRKINQEAIAATDYFETLVRDKKQQPSNDLLSRLMVENKNEISEHQLLSNSIFLLFAGQETTTSLLSNAVHALLMNPAQLLKLRQQPELIDNAVEEFLRYDPSIQMVGRLALEEIELEDKIIKKGDHVFAFLGAAGRDPLANQHPHNFDIDRDKVNHLAFTRGTHHCLGAILAKLEIKVFVQELLHAFEHLELAPGALRRRTWLMRGFDRLPVATAPPSLVAKNVSTPMKIKLGEGLYPFGLDDLAQFDYDQYRLINVFGKISVDQQQACIAMWSRAGVKLSAQEAQKRALQVCYLIQQRSSEKIVGVSTLYLDTSLGDDELFYANRMFIEVEHRSSRLMITGTAMLICYAKQALANKAIRGIININENTKLSRPGMQRIFQRLGYRYFTQQNAAEVILFEFDQVEYQNR
ncbi:MAG: pimeloyl-[acyl-carrier protein] synthase [Pseudoalteromonas tetraodonis]|jgi:pimeloyl-[acyl-carrier protein] synthase